MIHQQIEEGFDNIAEVDDEIRGIVATGLTCRPSSRRKMADAVMARKPEAPPPQSTKWTICKVAAKQTWLREVEAMDEHEAIEKGAERVQGAGQQADGSAAG